MIFHFLQFLLILLSLPHHSQQGSQKNLDNYKKILKTSQNIVAILTQLLRQFFEVLLSLLGEGTLDLTKNIVSGLTQLLRYFC